MPLATESDAVALSKARRRRSAMKSVAASRASARGAGTGVPAAKQRSAAAVTAATMAAAPSTWLGFGDGSEAMAHTSGTVYSKIVRHTDGAAEATA
jgi:hypothetical protein